jgi:hypothetical protein
MRSNCLLDWLTSVLVPSSGWPAVSHGHIRNPLLSPKNAYSTRHVNHKARGRGLRQDPSYHSSLILSLFANLRVETIPGHLEVFVELLSSTQNGFQGSVVWTLSPWDPGP